MEPLYARDRSKGIQRRPPKSGPRHEDRKDLDETVKYAIDKRIGVRFGHRVEGRRPDPVVTAIRALHRCSWP